MEKRSTPNEKDINRFYLQCIKTSPLCIWFFFGGGICFRDFCFSFFSLTFVCRGVLVKADSLYSSSWHRADYIDQADL